MGEHGCVHAGLLSQVNVYVEVKGQFQVSFSITFYIIITII